MVVSVDPKWLRFGFLGSFEVGRQNPSIDFGQFDICTSLVHFLSAVIVHDARDANLDVLLAFVSPQWASVKDPTGNT